MTWGRASRDQFVETEIFQLESVTDVGIKLGAFRLGWMHECAHPVVPFLGTYQWLGQQIVPRWDSAYDAIYLRLEAGKR